MAEDPSTEHPTARELTLTRLLDAPRHLVWRAWTDPEHFAAWFGPRGYSVPLSMLSMDIRPGGECQFVMRSDADGSENLNRGVFLEVEEPERLVLRDHDVDLVVTVTLAEEGARTRMTVHVTGDTGGDVAVAGWDSSFDKLAETLAA